MVIGILCSKATNLMLRPRPSKEAGENVDKMPKWVTWKRKSRYTEQSFQEAHFHEGYVHFNWSGAEIEIDTVEYLLAQSTTIYPTPLPSQFPRRMWLWAVLGVVETVCIRIIFITSVLCHLFVVLVINAGEGRTIKRNYSITPLLCLLLKNE